MTSHLDGLYPISFEVPLLVNIETWIQIHDLETILFSLLFEMMNWRIQSHFSYTSPFWLLIHNQTADLHGQSFFSKLQRHRDTGSSYHRIFQTLFVLLSVIQHHKLSSDRPWIFYNPLMVRIWWNCESDGRCTAVPRLLERWPWHRIQVRIHHPWK